MHNLACLTLYVSKAATAAKGGYIFMTNNPAAYSETKTNPVSMITCIFF